MDSDVTANRAPDGADDTLSERVYAGIVDGIVGGEFPPDSRLPSEVALARRFAVSRPIVREALARLRDHNFIRSRRGSGSWVLHKPDDALTAFAPVSSIADIQRCFEFRSAVEGRAAALAAERLDARARVRIEAAYADLEEVVRGNAVGAEADFAFHLAVVAAARNDFFRAALEMLQGNILLSINLMRNLSLRRPRQRLRRVQDEHLAVLEAILARDPEAAERAMSFHIASARARLFDGGESG